MIAFFFREEVDFDEAAFKKTILDDELARELLAVAIERFEVVAWDAASLHALTIEIGESLGLVLRKAQAPIRCAVTGSLVGPPLFESLEILGRTRTLARLRNALGRDSQ